MNSLGNLNRAEYIFQKLELYDSGCSNMLSLFLNLCGPDPRNQIWGDIMLPLCKWFGDEEGTTTKWYPRGLEELVHLPELLSFLI